MLDVDLTEYQEINKKFNSAFAFFNFEFSTAMEVATNPIRRAI